MGKLKRPSWIYAFQLRQCKMVLHSNQTKQRSRWWWWLIIYALWRRREKKASNLIWVCYQNTHFQIYFEPEKVLHNNMLVCACDVANCGYKGKTMKCTYRVNSSVNCVWSGGKNFTTNRRMVFFGPDGRNEQVHIHIISCYRRSD